MATRARTRAETQFAAITKQTGEAVEQIPSPEDKQTPQPEDKAVAHTSGPNTLHLPLDAHRRETADGSSGPVEADKDPTSPRRRKSNPDRWPKTS